MEDAYNSHFNPLVRRRYPRENPIQLLRMIEREVELVHHAVGAYRAGQKPEFGPRGPRGKRREVVFVEGLDIFFADSACKRWGVD